MRYTELLKIDKNLLFLIQGHDKFDREAFYYVLVDRLKKDIFLKEINLGLTDLRRFGKILISGFGSEPTADAKQFLKNEFNVDVE